MWEQYKQPIFRYARYLYDGLAVKQNDGTRMPICVLVHEARATPGTAEFVPET